MKTKGLGHTLESGRQATRERRTHLAEEFRQQLKAELPTATFAELALIDAATSAYVIVQELSTRYERGRCTERDIAALSLARGQLVRTLRALNLANGPAEPAEPQPGAALEEWARQRRERATSAGDSVPSQAQP